MTCTQCSGSHGLAASGVPWGQDLPLTTATPFVRGLLLKKTEQPGPPQCHGEVGHSASSLSGQRKGRAAGCSEAQADQHLGPHVSALEPPPSSPGTCGARCAAPPFSLSLCCHVSLLPNWAPWPFPVLRGGGAGFLLPHALGPQPGNSGHQVPSIEPSSPPGFPRVRSGQLLPGTISRMLVVEEPVSPLPPWGLV